MLGSDLPNRDAAWKEYLSSISGVDFLNSEAETEGMPYPALFPPYPAASPAASSSPANPKYLPTSQTSQPETAVEPVQSIHPNPALPLEGRRPVMPLSSGYRLDIRPDMKNFSTKDLEKANSVAASLGNRADSYFLAASRQNAAARQQADAYNTQAADREQLTNTQLAQNYEQQA